MDKDNITTKLCPICGMKEKCIKEEHEGKLTVYCLEGIFNKK